MSAVPAARVRPLLLLLAVQLGAAAGAPQPWHCAPCSTERLALCPPVPASCPELARPTGCGCCPTCALPLGAACGMATARCARGLRCRALPGEPRPLHALTRGQGACMPAPDSVPLSPEATGTTVAPPGPLPWDRRAGLGRAGERAGARPKPTACGEQCRPGPHQPHNSAGELGSAPTWPAEEGAAGGGALAVGCPWPSSLQGVLGREPLLPPSPRLECPLYYTSCGDSMCLADVYRT